MAKMVVKVVAKMVVKLVVKRGGQTDCKSSCGTDCKKVVVKLAATMVVKRGLFSGRVAPMLRVTFFSISEPPTATDLIQYNNNCLFGRNPKCTCLQLVFFTGAFRSALERATPLVGSVSARKVWLPYNTTRKLTH